MTTILKGIGLVIAGVVVGYLAHASAGKVFGEYKQTADYFYQGLFAGTSNQFSVSSAGVVTVGSSGTAVTQLQKGTCSLIAANYSVSASTTVAMDCAITGVVSGDTVFASFATSTNAVMGWAVTGSAASTTSGFITVGVTNGTGATAIIPASVASSTKYLILR